MTQPTVFFIGCEADVETHVSKVLGLHGIAFDSFESAEQFLARKFEDPSGCLVIDQDLPAMKGQTLFAATRNAGWTTPAIIVSHYNDVAACVGAFRSGISDYFQKPVKLDELTEAIKNCLAQDARLRDFARKKADAMKRLESLTPSERKVMHRLFNGHSMMQISEEFGTSFQATSRHRMGIQRKFEIESDVLLFRYVLEYGLEKELGNPGTGMPVRDS